MLKYKAYKNKPLTALSNYALTQIIYNIEDTDNALCLVLRDIEESETVKKLNDTRRTLDQLRIKIAKEQIKRDNQ